MTVRPILRYPDPRLKMPVEPVTVFDQGLAAVAEDLLDTIRSAPGIGITGPHIGVMQAITVIEIDAASGAHVYVNPRIVASSAERGRHVEGSVSMPGFTEEVDRPIGVTVHYQMLDGTDGQTEADGLMAVCLQHEIDQLNGIFWIQRLSRLKRERLVKAYEKARRS